MRRRVYILAVMVSAFASVMTARSETFTCSFGDSTGVAYHQGNWTSGTKAGSLAIVYRTQSPARAAREAQGDSKLDSVLIEAGFGKQIVTNWGPAPATAVEVTTIAGSGQRRAAVRSVQVLALADAPSVTIDHGHCEVVP